MPKLRRKFSFVSRPFCCPMSTTARPRSRAVPPTMAGSSRNNRSPCSSMKSVKTVLM